VNKLVKILVLAVLSFSFAYTVNAAMDDDSIRARLQSVGKVCVEGDDCGTAATAAASGPRSGKEIYESVCAGCHGTGAMGAPKVGNAADWKPRADQGLETLIKHAISGFNAMPPKGTCSACSDDEIAETIKYMLEQSK